MRTLATTFDARPAGNCLNALRLALAAGVVVSHAFPLTGREEISGGGMNLGTWCVIGFFVISGFLITRSRSREESAQFFWRRSLRIVPAFVVVLVLTAFVFAPLSTVLADGSWDLGSALSYLAHNAALHPPRLNQWGIADTLGSVPYRIPAWNGPLWTLFWEGVCYVAVGVLGSAVPRRGLRPLVLATVVCLTPVVAFTTTDASYWLFEEFLPLALAFAVGACAYVYRARVPIDHLVAGVSVLALAFLWSADASGAALAPIPMMLVVFWLSAHAPLRAIGARHDLSYGTYIYGWPIQMLVVAAAVEHGLDLPLAVNIAIVGALTLGFAWLSFCLIERPALALRSRPPFRPRASGPPAHILGVTEQTSSDGGRARLRLS